MLRLVNAGEDVLRRGSHFAGIQSLPEIRAIERGMDAPQSCRRLRVGAGLVFEEQVVSKQQAHGRHLVRWGGDGRLILVGGCRIRGAVSHSAEPS